jgi:hypothetical protein
MASLIEMIETGLVEGHLLWVELHRLGVVLPGDIILEGVECFILCSYSTVSLHLGSPISLKYPSY